MEDEMEHDKRTIKTRDEGTRMKTLRMKESGERGKNES